MPRTTKFITSLIVLSLVLSIAPIGAAAQENTTSHQENVTNQTAHAHENETVEPEPAYLEQIDDRTRITDWQYVDGEFTLDLDADRATKLTITEAVQFQEGTGTGTIQTKLIPSGESTVTIPIQERNEKAGVVITTSRSLNAGTFTYVSTGQTNTQSPFERTSSTSGWLGGAATVGFMFVFVAYREIRKEATAPEVAE